MAVKKATTRKTTAKATGKRTTTRKTAARAAKAATATVKAKPAAAKATAKTTAARTKPAASAAKAGSVAEIRTQIDKLKGQLQQALTKEMASLNNEIVKHKKRIATNLAKSKKAAERVKAARDAYRVKPTVAAKTRYAKAREAAKLVKDELAGIRAASRALADQLAAAKASERRENKLQTAIEKLTATIDKPQKKRGRKKGTGRVGRPRKTTTRAKSTKAAAAKAESAGTSSATETQ